MWVLDVVTAPSDQVVQSFYLIAGEWSIGRKKCHFNFNTDSSISRTHALIQVGSLSADEIKDPATRPTLTLTDQGSRFGSFVNNEQFNGSKVLKHGDEIAFGAKRTLLRVRYHAFVLVASRIQRANRAVLQEACQRLGMHLVNNERADATHCIMDPGRMVATVKVLWALVYNQPVVCTTWITAILERRNLSEPLPRCEEFLPEIDNMPGVATNYLPNPMRKTLFEQHVVVFLMPQPMERIIESTGGRVIAAYNDPAEDSDLLKKLSTSAATYNVVVVEPMVGTGSSSGAGSSDGRDALTASHAVVERRAALLRNAGFSFTTIQELAAGVLFVRIPQTHSQPSTNSHAPSHDSAAFFEPSSFPEHLHVPHSNIASDSQRSRSVKHEPVERESVVADSHLQSDELNTVAPSICKDPKPILVEEAVSIKDDVFPRKSPDIPLSGGPGWLCVRRAESRKRNGSDDIEKPDLVVLNTQLVVTRANVTTQAGTRSCDSGYVNFKRFRKGNINRNRTMTPQTDRVVGVIVDNSERRAIQENLDVLEEQERIAEELFAMVEKRGTTRKR